jgi:hypothetical protein
MGSHQSEMPINARSMRNLGRGPEDSGFGWPRATEDKRAKPRTGQTRKTEENIVRSVSNQDDGERKYRQ